MTNTSLDSRSHLVLDVNRVFHDLEGCEYDAKHDEIFVDEVDRWKRIGAEVLRDTAPPRKILDVGTGTGFIPLQLGEILNRGDGFVCSDLSVGKLRVCEENVRQRNFDATFQFTPVDGSSYPFEDQSFHVITMNSVLHHIPDIEGFLAELDRLLVPGGRLLIGHEPNQRYYRNRFLLRNARLTWSVLRPTTGLAATVKACRIDRLFSALGVRSSLRHFYLKMRGGEFSAHSDAHEKLLHRVNQQLLEEKVIESPLTAEEIVMLVDFHSPTAGKTLAPERGIDVDELGRRFLGGYEREHLETYHHLGESTSHHAVARGYDRYLAARHPRDGASLFVVFRKSL